jgi:hypothetical protein
MAISGRMRISNPIGGSDGSASRDARITPWHSQASRANPFGLRMLTYPLP